MEAGSHGIVAPVNASEGPTLTDEERLRVTRVVVEATAGRVPVVVGVSGVSTQASALYTRHAREVGADAVIAMPPYGVRVSDPDSIFAFYQAVANTADGLPVFIQNWSGPAGTAMGVPLLVRLLTEIDNVSYSKEETVNAGHMMTATLAAAGAEARRATRRPAARPVVRSGPRTRRFPTTSILRSPTPRRAGSRCGRSTPRC